MLFVSHFSLTHLAQPPLRALTFLPFPPQWWETISNLQLSLSEKRHLLYLLILNFWDTPCPQKSRYKPRWPLLDLCLTYLWGLGLLWNCSWNCSLNRWTRNLNELKLTSQRARNHDRIVIQPCWNLPYSCKAPWCLVGVWPNLNRWEFGYFFPSILLAPARITWWIPLIGTSYTFG